MTHRNWPGRRVLSLFFLIVFLLAFTSCQRSKSEQLLHQISALETQNAILLSNSQPQVDDSQVPPPPVVDSSGSEVEVSVPTPESLPTGTVPAGQPVVYDGWSMTVSQELNLNSSDNIWGIDIYVRNLGETDRVFRFTNSSITAKDDTGFEFLPSTLCPYMGCSSCEEYYHLVKNLEISANSSTTISSGTSGNGCMDDDGVGMFVGPLSMEAQHLIIHVENFGPFTGFDVQIDL